jgi:uncharacterized protein YyaL (SSP411 family)
MNKSKFCQGVIMPKKFLKKTNKKLNKKPNRLINEKSPYLLQHAYNPVNWYPWSDEAFQKASDSDKPIFLSIGYSTCHWCHVMEHESFEDSDVAKLMNDTFISIKVDREERPDIDNIYMNVCQAITGGGGWPLTIIMTPEKKPFYAGTYLPKEPRFNQPGLIRLTKAIKQMWSNQRGELLSSADNITTTLQTSVKATNGDDLDESVLKSAFDQLSNRYDPGFGGFGMAPKFPEPHILMYLLRYWHRTGDEHALQMVTHTLDYMRRGGIFDHLGKGFHRYSTDQHWLVPHFEKMLYDQALLAMAYTEAFQATGNELYKNTAQEIFTYVLRDMTSPEGGFYSAEDADSEGEEGKFYTWTYDEFQKILSSEELDFVSVVFNTEEFGNFIDSVARKKTGGNILHHIESSSKLAEKLNLTEKEFNQKLVTIRQKLYKIRSKRVRPHMDDKILTDWNGLMIAALAKGAQAFGSEKLRSAAENAVKLILDKLYLESENKLLHRYRDNEAAVPGFLNDYAFLSWGLIELYETTFKPEYIETAKKLITHMLEHFWDFKDGGLFFTPDYNEELILRNKESYDGALPSGNSVAFNNLVRLSRLTKDHKLEAKADDLERGISKIVKRSPAAHTMLLSGLDFVMGQSFEVLIKGDIKQKETKEMLKAVRTNFIPNKIVHLNLEQGDIIKTNSNDLFDLNLPDPANKTIQEHRINEPLAYICVNYSCQRPTSDIPEMLKQLGVKNPN